MTQGVWREDSHGHGGVDVTVPIKRDVASRRERQCVRAQVLIRVWKCRLAGSVASAWPDVVAQCVVSCTLASTPSEH